MKIAHYTKNNLLVGISEARKNPLEDGKFLIPAGATTILPIDSENYFNGIGWEIIENHIGKKAYLKLDPLQTIIINKLGDIDFLYTLEVPKFPEYQEFKNGTYKTNKAKKIIYDKNKIIAYRENKISDKYKKELEKLIWQEVKKNKDGDLTQDDIVYINKKIK